MKKEFLDWLFLNYGYDSLIIVAMLYHTIFFHNIEDEDFYNEIEDNVQKVTKGSEPTSKGSRGPVDGNILLSW